MTRHRNATLSELDMVLNWAAQEGWNPGLDDAPAFCRADPDGFFLAVDGDDRPVAAISVVNHTDTFAFLGLYLVRPAFRGRGIGLGLWQHALAHAGTRTIGLDGVEAQQANYMVSGFAHAGGTTRFSGAFRGQSDRSIRRATPADIPALIAKEAAGSGIAKPAYLAAWLTNSARRRTLVLDGPDGIAGFCTQRSCRAGIKIGPLVADDSNIAARLIAHAAWQGDGHVTLDVPATAGALTTLCRALGLSPGFRTARMYRGPFEAAAHPCFAVTSLELG